MFNTRAVGSMVVVVCLLAGACVSEDDERLDQLTEEAIVSRPWPTHRIPVCWENPSSADEYERFLVRDAVERTWSNVADVDFVGWGACTPDERSVRIEVADVPPTGRVGWHPEDAPVPSMQLNFTFVNWAMAGCMGYANRTCCIQAIAVHEFGHALGFAHEQDRPDTDRTRCPDSPTRYDDAEIIGPWDLYSVMNYCNPTWNNRGNLSPMDIRAVRQVYGERTPTRPLLNPSCAPPDAQYEYDERLACTPTCCDGATPRLERLNAERECRYMASVACARHGALSQLDFGGATVLVDNCARGGHGQRCDRGRCTAPDRCFDGVCRSPCEVRCRDERARWTFPADDEDACVRRARAVCRGRGGVRRVEFEDERVRVGH